MGKDKSLFICFIGIDGSGKTTQAEALTDSLRGWGVESRYVWSRFEPRLIKPCIGVAKWLFFRGKDAYVDYAGYVDTKRTLSRNSILHRAYECLLLFDYCLQVAMRIQFLLIRGVTVVCDRYVYDTVADLATDFGYTPELAERKLESYLRVFPVPDLVFLLDLPEEIAFQRKDDVPSLDYLRGRRQVYSLLEQEHNTIMIDGVKTIQDIESIVAHRVKERL